MTKNKLNFNRLFEKKDIKHLINWFIQNYGSIRTSKLLEKLKKLGFKYSTMSGISIGIEDLKIPRIKKKLLKNVKKELSKEKIKNKKGKIEKTQYLTEKNEKWNKLNEILTLELITNLEQTDSLNPVYIMITSGARGNLSQIKQIIGMRGLMSDAQGAIIDTPVTKNLKEGLDISEYFIASYGARKGIIDTALKTANSGYLTRKLIYTSQHITIKKPDCYTKYNIAIKNKELKFGLIQKNLLGRILSKNIELKVKGKIIEITSGQDICRYIIKKLVNSKKIYIRSPLTCETNVGLCQLCYGWNLANGQMIELGETVGIIAAQSIGEPGTQLTMRTFHTGGIANFKTTESLVSPVTGKIFYNIKKEGKIIENKNKEKVFLTLKNKKIIILSKNNNKLTFNIPKLSIIFIKNKEKVNLKQIIAEKINWKTFKDLQNKKENKIANQNLIVKTNISGQLEILKRKKCNNIMITNGNIYTYKRLKENLTKTNKIKLQKK